MKDIPQNVPLASVSMLSMGTRLMQLGLDEFQSALGLQIKCIDRDRVAVQRACHALLEARAYDPAAFLQTWQTLVRDYFAASAALCEQSQDLATRSQAAFGALLREAALDFEKACTQVQARAQAAYPAGAVPQAADWMTYLGQFVGGRPDGEAMPQSRSVPASA
ncbi:hypothetical protein [Paraburkholderia lycopersici]|uniref:Phasin protein n=1 Tax=Paraburkholderia lycopersici TaxID=416944 RepID=A0A1G6SHI2_9BURK|nr:hypothetical protein [Paraburkholderia lycopersici]SDD16114.1 hypothetical protein SAMN05421548_11571 [Paraburkholderia lycopersici]